jgi:hypothetical protein
MALNSDYWLFNPASLFLASSNEFPGQTNLSNTWVSVLPEGEEFLVVLDGCVFPYAVSLGIISPKKLSL